MIKTVKVKKQLNLHELIKYVWDNEYKNREYYSKDGILVDFMNRGDLSTDFFVSKDEVFTVEVEEPITEDTVFEDITVVCKINSRDETGHFYNSTLKDIKKAKNLLSAYIPLGGKLQLIWEAENE